MLYVNISLSVCLPFHVNNIHINLFVYLEESHTDGNIGWSGRKLESFVSLLQTIGNKCIVEFKKRNFIYRILNEKKKNSFLYYTLHPKFKLVVDHYTLYERFKIIRLSVWNI